MTAFTIVPLWKFEIFKIAQTVSNGTCAIRGACEWILFHAQAASFHAAFIDKNAKHRKAGTRIERKPYCSNNFHSCSHNFEWPPFGYSTVEEWFRGRESHSSLLSAAVKHSTVHLTGTRIPGGQTWTLVATSIIYNNILVVLNMAKSKKIVEAPNPSSKSVYMHVKELGS